VPKTAVKRRRRSKGMKGRVQHTFYLDAAETLELMAAVERTGFTPAAVTAACTMYGVRLINSGKLKLPELS
jgi:hypothetical protein